MGNNVPICLQVTVLTQIQRKIHCFSTKFSLLEVIIAIGIRVCSEEGVNEKVNCEERDTSADDHWYFILGGDLRGAECAG